MEFPEKLSLARTPTPIDYLGRLTKALEGPEIFVKRDDLTGLGMTGNKVRKLEFLLADARKQGADVVITCGGVQSNHARATALAAARLGMRCKLVLRQNGTARHVGNLFLDRLADAEVEFVTSEGYERVNSHMQQMADTLQKQGSTPYVIPEGGSNALGAFGYISAMQEFSTQIREQSAPFDVIISAVGSGGTYAGMVLGKHIFDVPGELWGINVCDSAEYFVKHIGAIIDAFRERWPQAPQIRPEALQIVDGFVGKGYALSRQDELNTIKQLAALEGMLLDPVYTGKAMFALRTLVAEGKLGKGQRVLFWHTGGVFGLFPKANLFF